jgi:hypothetical protein
MNDENAKQNQSASQMEKLDRVPESTGAIPAYHRRPTPCCCCILLGDTDDGGLDILVLGLTMGMALRTRVGAG